MITIGDMRTQVIRALDGRESEYDVDGIVERIHAQYGLVDIDELGPDFWQVVEGYAVQDWYFTFGIGHAMFARRYVKIRGTADGARGIMFDVFGSGWAFQYGSAELAGVERHGLTQLN